MKKIFFLKGKIGLTYLLLFSIYSVGYLAYAELTPEQKAVFDEVIKEVKKDDYKEITDVVYNNLVSKELINFGNIVIETKHTNIYTENTSKNLTHNEVGKQITYGYQGIPGSNIALGSGNLAGIMLEPIMEKKVIQGEEKEIVVGYKRERRESNLLIPIWNKNKSNKEGSYATAIGFFNAAYGVGSVAIGQYNAAGARSSFAGGWCSMATNNQAFAFGEQVKAIGENSVAFGKESKAYGNFSFVFGEEAVADGDNSIAIGNNSFAKMNGIAIGDESKSSGNYAMAYGSSSKAIGVNSLAAGSFTVAKGEGSLAVGAESESDAFFSTAIGGGKTSKNAEFSLAIGAESKTEVAKSVALGPKSLANRNADKYGYDIEKKEIFNENTLAAYLGKVEELKKINSVINEKQQQIEPLEKKLTKLKKYQNDMFEEGKYIDDDGNEVEFTSENSGKLDNEIEKVKKEYNTISKELQRSIIAKNKIIGTYHSSLAAISVGNEETGDTRQIIGVAAGTEDTDAVNVAQLKALEKKMKNGNSINVEAGDSFFKGVYISEETDGSKVIYEKHNGEFYNTNELNKNKIKYDEEKKIFVKEDGSELDKQPTPVPKTVKDKIKTTEVKLKDNAKLGNINSIDFINNGKTYNFTVINDGKVKIGDKEYDLTNSGATNITLTAGKNITIDNNAINLNDSISLKSARFKNSKDEETININGENGVIKVKDLTDASDGTAVANKNYVDQKTKELSKVKGAVAGAIAMANLPQVMNPNAHNLSAALGYQEKTLALALGLSGTNKKGNLVYKASGSINTAAQVSLGAGIGYQFGTNEIVDVNDIKNVVTRNTNKIKSLEEKLEIEKKVNKERYEKLEKELEEIKKILNKR